MTKQELKVHYATKLGAWRIACNNWLNFIGATPRTTDKSLVTCLTCKRTTAFKEA